jgi:type II secretory ATPase GspE/PulE/Tfp pilus assembly ATPase PilB-like protein
MSTKPFLEIHTPDGRRQVPVGDEPVTIGRHPENAVVISDPVSSRRHCVVERTPNGWRVRDLNSSNGTRLNGLVIEQSRLLPGDIITIGGTRIVLVVPSAKPVKAASAREDTMQDAEPIPFDDGPDLAALERLGQEAEDAEEVSEADILDEADVITEDDLVEVQDDDSAPLRLERSDDENNPAISVSQESDDSWEPTLRELSESLPNKPFGEYDIATISARGAVVHPAAPPDKKKARQEAVDLLRLLLLITARSRATDIHMEPKGEFYQVRLRIDGIMVDVVRLPNEVGVKLTALVKIISDIDVTQKSIVQEGHFAAKVPGRKIDYRISFAPSVFGQKLVVRVQDTALSPAKIRDLNLPEWMFKEVAQTIEMDQGMVLICGPTGSGKTTTLYSLIRSSDTARKNFVTIEDPVEIQIDGVTQIPVDEAEGKSFSALLRSVLRQDPDCIMVGEIRDPETARIAMQAAITGHMVFSTVHTTSTVGTVFRLLDLGVEPYLIAQGLHLVLAQRLVRQLCPFCKRPVKPTADQIARLPEAAKGVKQLYVPGGCPRCLSTGYSGRRAFFELLHTTEELRETIVKNPTMADVNKALVNTRFEKLQQTGFQLVADGVVPFDEIEKAVGR